MHERELAERLIDELIKKGEERDLERLERGSDRLFVRSVLSRASVALVVVNAFRGELESVDEDVNAVSEEGECEDDDDAKEVLARAANVFASEYLEFLSTSSTSARDVDDDSNFTTKDDYERIELKKALESLRKDALEYKSVEEQLELKKLHLEMLREEREFMECLNKVEKMIASEKMELEDAFDLLEVAQLEYAVEIPNERIEQLQVQLEDAIRRKIALSLIVISEDENENDDHDNSFIVIVKFQSARDAWNVARKLSLKNNNSNSNNLFKECAVFMTRKIVDEIIVPFVMARSTHVEIEYDDCSNDEEKKKFVQTLKWENNRRKFKKNDNNDISKYVAGLERVLFEAVLSEKSPALDGLSPDLLDVSRAVVWPTVSKTCIETWNLSSSSSNSKNTDNNNNNKFTDDDVDSVIALEKRVASLGLLNYGLGSGGFETAGPLEVAAMEGEIESRLDFRVSALASAREAGKTLAVSDELLRTRAKEEGEYKEDDDNYNNNNNDNKMKYCEEFFELNCFEQPTSRTITSSAVKLLNVTKNAFHSVLVVEDKENKDANTPAGRKRHAIAAIKTACDSLEAFRCSRMGTRDESIFKQSLFESLVFYNDCGFIADQFIAQSLDATKALQKLVKKDSTNVSATTTNEDKEQQQQPQGRPAILWAVEALRNAGDVVYMRAEHNAFIALEESLEVFSTELLKSNINNNNNNNNNIGLEINTLKKSVAISRDVLKKFCSATNQTLSETNAKHVAGKFVKSYASRIVSAIQEVEDISADDADTLADVLEDAFTPFDVHQITTVDTNLVLHWQKGLMLKKLLKTKLKEITESYVRGEMKLLFSEDELVSFISACFADTPLRDECFERIFSCEF
jgi:hypothetical protein